MRSALLALLALAACGFEARSEAYRCDDGTICRDGRTCQDGWCVLPGGGPGIDASPGEGDASLGCPEVCTNCDDGVCLIDCSTDACEARVVCPAGIPCRVLCALPDSCEGGIDCRAASACDLMCVGIGSCDGDVDCGPGRCSIACSGAGSCDREVDCDRSCACDTTCDGASACGMQPDCPFQECRSNGGSGEDCVSQRDGETCDTCD